MVVLWDTSTGKNVDVNGKLIDLLSFDDLRVQLPAVSTAMVEKCYVLRDMWYTWWGGGGGGSGGVGLCGKCLIS